jgi:heat shock protein HslJ
MALEARYLEALQSATNYAIQGNTLTISYLGGVLSFADKPAATPY